MQFTLPTLAAVLLGLASAAPAAQENEASTAVQIANLVFHGGPAQYSLAVPADGTVVPTSMRDTP